MPIKKGRERMKTFLIAVVIWAAFILTQDALDKRDARIAQLENAAYQAADCRPLTDSEIAVIAMRNGNIECAVTSNQRGRRAVIRRTS
jgi:hypothetical protein